MKAVILAAGLGTRMKPLTDTVPKPMLKILNKPILEYTLKAVHDYVDEIIIVVGYKSEVIKDYFKDNYRNVPITYIEQPEQLGTGHAVLCAAPFIKDKFILIPGDDFIQPSLIENLTKHNLAVAAVKVENPKSFGIIEVKDDYIIGFEEKPSNPKSNIASTAIWVMNKKLLDIMKSLPKSPRGEYEITDALRELIKTEKVYCEIVDSGWMPIGYPEDLNKVEKYLGEQND